VEGLIVPSKYYGVAAAGRSTIYIGSADGEIARIVARAGSGVIVEPGDGAGLACRVLELSRDAGRVAGMGERARRDFEATYDVERAVEHWVDVLERAATARDRRFVMLAKNAR
jgi:glycosyltransferase involved in cell wall biosynthesis